MAYPKRRALYERWIAHRKGRLGKTAWREIWERRRLAHRSPRKYSAVARGFWRRYFKDRRQIQDLSSIDKNGLANVFIAFAKYRFQAVYWQILDSIGLMGETRVQQKSSGGCRSFPYVLYPV